MRFYADMHGDTTYNEDLFYMVVRSTEVTCIQVWLCVAGRLRVQAGQLLCGGGHCFYGELAQCVIVDKLNSGSGRPQH